MNIVLILESPYVEGRWRRFDLIYKHLQLNNKVKILAFSGRKTNREDLMDIRVPPLLRMVGTAIHFLTFKLISNPSYLIKVCFELRKIRPDVAVFHHYDLGLFLLAFKPIFFKNTKLVYDLNDLRIRMGYYSKRETPLFKLFVWIEEVLIPKKVDRIIVPTNFGKTYLCKKSIDSKKIFVLNELVDLASFSDVEARKKRIASFRKGERTLVWHGFIRHYQADAIAMIIKAIAKAQKKITQEIKLLIVGPFAQLKYKEKLTSLAEKLKVNAEFKGGVPSSQVPLILNTAHIGIQPLSNALFTRFINGVKLSEYICSGLPVLCSNLEGPAELVKDNGFLFNSDDSTDLADKILKAFAEYSKLESNSRKIAKEEFSREAIKRKIRELEEFLKK
jgi:glycosyltransferase involved in cell wall biosynthesis